MKGMVEVALRQMRSGPVGIDGDAAAIVRQCLGAAPELIFDLAGGESRRLAIARLGLRSRFGLPVIGQGFGIARKQAIDVAQFVPNAAERRLLEAGGAGGGPR